MTRTKFLTGCMVAAIATFAATAASANGYIISSNNTVQLGANDNGSIDASTSGGFVGIGYNFTGQGGRVGYQDALTPGCACESWGVAANGIEGQVGDVTGNIGIGVLNSSNGTSDNSSHGPTSTFTSNTVLTAVPGLSVTQVFSQAATTATGALFQDQVTITNGTGAVATDVRYARAMDWDIPPTEFNEVMTFKGNTTTADLIHQTDNGFAYALPLTSAFTDTGICGPIDGDGTTGPCDHGALYDFAFGNLAAGASKTFDIFYGAGANFADAIALLTDVGPELYNIGQSNSTDGCSSVRPSTNADEDVGAGGCNDFPNFIFAFKGVGGTILTPPTGVPEPLTLSLFGAGLAGAAAMRRRRRKA